MNPDSTLAVTNTCPKDGVHLSLCNCRTWQTDSFFAIMAKNMFNRRQPRRSTCAGHPDGNTPHIGNDHSFICLVKWLDFTPNIGMHIDIADGIRDNLVWCNKAAEAIGCGPVGRSWPVSRAPPVAGVRRPACRPALASADEDPVGWPRRLAPHRRVVGCVRRCRNLVSIPGRSAASAVQPDVGHHHRRARPVPATGAPRGGVAGVWPRRRDRAAPGAPVPFARGWADAYRDKLN